MATGFDYSVKLFNEEVQRMFTADTKIRKVCDNGAGFDDERVTLFEADNGAFFAQCTSGLTLNEDDFHRVGVNCLGQARAYVQNELRAF